MSGRLSQLLRRSIQLGVLAFVAYTALGEPWRNFKHAHNSRRLVGLMEGDFAAFCYGLNEDALRWLGEPYRRSLDYLGMPWASRVAGIDSVDPILLLSQLVQRHAVPLSLLCSALLPVALAVLLGKVFCSHLCPMRFAFELAGAVRAGLLRLGIPLAELRSDLRFGGYVLLGGLAASAVAGSAVWLFILPYFSLSMGIFLLITASSGAGLLATALLWFVVEVAVAPGYFCYNLCPTGFVLEQLGRVSLLRLKKSGSEPCPSGCNACSRACPYGLSPKAQTHRPACDNCGRCAVACPPKRLSRRVSLPLITGAGLSVLLLSPAGAHAHHNKGLPHYGYFANYPQVPTEEYVAIAGQWEIGATLFNFQGLDRKTADTPNDVKIYLYLYNLAQDRSYTGPLSVELMRDDEVVTRFERLAVDEEAVYSTRETLPSSGNYELRASVEGKQVRLPFHVDIKDEGPSALIVSAIGAPVLLVLALALYGRGRKRTRRAVRALTHVSCGLLLCMPASSLAAPGHTPPAAGAQTVANATAAPRICPVCGMRDCPMHRTDNTDHASTTGRNTTSIAADARRAPGALVHAGMKHYRAPDGGQVMVMGGLPLWLFLCGVVAVIAGSFVAVEWRGARLQRARKREAFRLNLIRNKNVYRRLRNRSLQAVPQTLSVIALGALVYIGLFGSRVRNLTPAAVWTLWWAGLIFAVLVLGSAWCFVCPWDGLANLASRLRTATKLDTLSLKLPFPRALANVYPALALFALLTWLELGYGVTTDPRLTAYMGLGMAAAAVICALLWDNKRFCAHFCPVGRICGIYSNFSPVEIRARNPRTCQVCTTEDCLHGNRDGYACPTGLSLKTLQHSTLCTACTECIKSCDKHNVALNIRPFGADLAKPVTPRTDEAWLALMLLSLTLFHGLSMTPAWESFEPGRLSVIKWLHLTLGFSRLGCFSLAMGAAVLLPIGLYATACKAASLLATDGTNWRSLFVAYAYSLLPVALFYHLAHNLMHLLMEGGQVATLVSDPMGSGQDYFGTASLHLGAAVNAQTLWFMQVVLILIGHVYGIVVAHGVGHRIHHDPRAARRSLIPVPAVMVLISVCGLWLMHMDMNMRIGRM